MKKNILLFILFFLGSGIGVLWGYQRGIHSVQVKTISVTDSNGNAYTAIYQYAKGESTAVLSGKQPESVWQAVDKNSIIEVTIWLKAQ